MARVRLTSAAVERFSPPKTGQAEYFDELLPSFGLRVSSSGTKAWIVMTRINGKLTRLTIGRYPAMDLAGARKRARELLGLVAQGVDPRQMEEQKRLQRRIDSENTFDRLAQTFMTTHVEPNLRVATAREYRRILFGKDTAAWHGRPVSSIKKRDVLDFIDMIDARGAKSAARLALAYLRKFFNWCVDREIIETSPIERIRLGGNLRSRARVLNENEVRLIWRAFDNEAGFFGPLFQLLLMTGQRRNEVAGMRWDELSDLNGDPVNWEIPGTRTKNHRAHIVPLPPQAVAILGGIPRTGPYVFSSTGRTPVSGFSKAKARVDGRLAEMLAAERMKSMPPWTLHDLRRTMVTMMNERLGIAPHIVEAIVNHVTGSAKAGIAGVYNRALYLEERRIALQRWNDLIVSLTG